MIERTSSSDVSDSSNRAEVVFSVPSKSFVLIREQTFFCMHKKRLPFVEAAFEDIMGNGNYLM